MLMVSRPLIGARNMLSSVGGRNFGRGQKKYPRGALRTFVEHSDP